MITLMLQWVVFTQVMMIFMMMMVVVEHSGDRMLVGVGVVMTMSERGLTPLHSAAATSSRS